MKSLTVIVGLGRAAQGRILLAPWHRSTETHHMSRALKKLPESKRRELDRVVATVLEGFAKATSTRKAERLRDGRILKIILYGSYARGDWWMIPSVVTSRTSTC